MRCAVCGVCRMQGRGYRDAHTGALIPERRGADAYYFADGERAGVCDTHAAEEARAALVLHGLHPTALREVHAGKRVTG